MRWLLHGGKGWIGSQVSELLHDDDVRLSQVRIAQRKGLREELEEEIRREKPDRVLCLLGRTSGGGIGSIDYLEGRLSENLRDNLFAPMVLAAACKSTGVHMTYLGTGCIFEYCFSEGKLKFGEDDVPNFFGSSYSVVKGHTDTMMKEIYPEVLNVRIRMPITADLHPKNFITKIAGYDKVINVPNSMTVLPELLPKMLEMSRRGLNGTVNLCNPGTISHNEVLDMYRELVDPNHRYRNFSVEEQDKVLLSRRSNNELDTGLLERLFPDVLPIRESVRRCLAQIGGRRNGGGAGGV
ncbi:MAG: Rossmann-fold NAD(P)-binding domain-containing protein [Sulfobacillus sp.]